MEFLPSKLAVPRKAPHLIPRPRLLYRLAESKARIILLVAPAGYGKTILASQLMERLPPTRRAWLDLDGRDDDPPRFLAYLLEALSHPIPSLRRTRLQERTILGRATPEETAEDLCFFLQERRGPECRLVLDNWEQVDSSPEISRLVARLVAGSLESVRLVVLSRVMPSFKIRRLQESGDALVIDHRDLAFTFDEFRDAARKRVRTRIKDDRLEEIWRLTAGWCVNLGLILERAGRHESGDALSRRISSGDIESIVGYVGEEILPGVDPDLLNFLARCSILDVLSPADCAVLVDNPEGVARDLARLSGSSLPLFVLPGTDTYRLHPVLREAANRILRRCEPPDRLNALYRRAADRLIEKGLVFEGIQTLLDRPDYPAALETIYGHWFRIVEMNGTERARKWLESFPESAREDPVYDIIMTNILSLSGNNQALVNYLADKIAPSSFPGNLKALGHSWMYYHWAWLHESDEPRYDIVARRWREMDEARGPFNPIVLAGVENILGYAALIELRIAKAEQHYRRSLEHQGDASFDYAATTKNNIALCRYWLGEADVAIAILRECLSECEQRSAFTIAPMLMLNVAEINLARGFYGEALGVIDRCGESMRAHGLENLSVEMGIDRIRGVAAWYTNRREEAWEYLESALARSARCAPAEGVGIGLLMEYFSAVAGRSRRIVHDDQVPPVGRRSENRLAFLGKECWLALQTGDIPRAEEMSKELLEAAEETTLRPWMVTGHFLAALIGGAKREEKPTAAHLRMGLAILEELGWNAYPMANERLSAFVFARAIRLGLDARTAARLVTGESLADPSEAFRGELSNASRKPEEERRILDAALEYRVRGLIGVAAPLATSRSPLLSRAALEYIHGIKSNDLPPLRIRMLGRFSVASGGREVLFPRRKSKLILQMLLIQFPEPVHDEVLTEEFWPDHPADKARAALQTSVRDLRRALDPYHEPRERSYIEYEEEHYSLALPEGTSCDYWEFRKGAQRAVARVASRDPIGEEAERAYLEVLPLFGGEFLPEQRYESFVQEHRERLHRLFLHVSLMLARSLNRAGHHARAIEILDRGMKLDPLWGEGVEEIMRAHAENGELCRALRAYREYERRLRDALDVPPDLEMTRLFESLAVLPAH